MYQQSNELCEDTDHHLKSLPRMPSYPRSPRTLPANAVLSATQRYNKEEWLPRTYFGAGFGSLHCVATARRELFYLFLNQIRYNATHYSEGIVSWKTRYPLIGHLLAEGYIHLMQTGDIHSKDTLFYLVPPAMLLPSPSRAMTLLSCTDLHNEKRWDRSLCCPECHRDPTRLLIKISDKDIQQYFTSQNGPEGRKALVCCRAFTLLPKDWYYGKIYQPDQLSGHEM